ncbi:hypothetical protein, partial [Paramuribaculum intestinale]|uniref:hypothetical protein n=1 Tax=Paramuribaculum intestinale TaxID=2094151 RepID=UPI0025B71399
MGHFGLFSNLFRSQAGGFQKYRATAHTVCVALALAKAFFQLQTLPVCQLYNFDFCDSCVYLYVY